MSENQARESKTVVIDSQVVVDSHIHLFPPEVAKHRERFGRLDSGFTLLYADPRHKMPTAEETIADMSQSGVDRAVILGFGWGDPTLCHDHNDYLAQIVRSYPDRFIGFGIVQPADAQATTTELQRIRSLGLSGVGELMPHLQGYSLADRRNTSPLAEAAVALGLPILTHASEPVGHGYPGKGDVTLQSLLALCGDYPDLWVIAAHWGGGLPFYELMPEVRKIARNLVYDTAASPFLYRSAIYEAVVGLVGEDKVLFGSDYPLIGFRRIIRQIEESNLSRRAKAKLLGANIIRLLGETNAPGAGRIGNGS